jgi:hypothetical protein
MFVAGLMLSTSTVDLTMVDRSASALAVTNSFSPAVIVNDNQTGDQVVPDMLVTPSGMLFLAWQDPRLGNGHIYTTTSTNNGTSFSPNVKADDSTNTSNPYIVLKAPAVAASSNNTLLLVWQDNRRSWGDYDIYFTKSYDGGKTFKKNVKVDDSNSTAVTWQERPSVAITSSGTICVAWTDDRDRVGQDPRLRIRVAVSTDWGATFSESTEVAPSAGSNSQDEASLVWSGNRLYLAYMDNASGSPHPNICTSVNGGKSFSSPSRLDSENASAVRQSGVRLAAMPGGGAVAVWQDSRNGPWEIFGTTVSANGKVADPDFRVDDDKTGFSQVYPCVSADQLGNVYAAWTDTEDGSSSAVRFSYMTDASGVFNSSIMISQAPPFTYQRTPAVVSPRPGLAIAAWQDDRAGTDDIYASAAYFPDLFGLSLLTGWNFISIPSDVTGIRASTLGLKTGDIVSRWNSTTQSFASSYIVGVSPSLFDFPIDSSTGYWVYTAGHERVNLKGAVPASKQDKQISVPAHGGWVILGFESLNTTRSASDIGKMLSVPGNVHIVSGFDVASGSSVVYVSGVPATDFTLSPGEGYWCYVIQSCTLSYMP